MAEAPESEGLFVNLNGVNVFYRMEGEGDVVILIHGLGESSDCFLRNITSIAEKHKVYALDLVGFGRSDKPKIDYSTDYYVGLIGDFMATLEIAQATLIGHSMGGLIALSAANRYGGKVKMLILIDSAGLPVALTLKLKILRKLLSIPILGSLIKLSIKRILSSRMHLSGLVCNLDVVPEACREYKKASGKAVRQLALELEVAKREEAISSIDIPTLLIWGAEDAFYPLTTANEFKALIKNSELIIIDNAGHYTQMEKPEECNAAILDFMSRLALSGMEGKAPVKISNEVYIPLEITLDEEEDLSK